MIKEFKRMNKFFQSKFDFSLKYLYLYLSSRNGVAFQFFFLNLVSELFDSYTRKSNKNMYYPFSY